jgi:pimeloyl-ACP methyl ester carboxylesterase
VPYLDLESGESHYYQRYDGPADMPCLVFLHEGLGCTAMWKDFPARLCAQTGLPGLSYDRNGYGRSSPFRKPRTVRYLHEAALEELPHVIGQLLPDRHYVLIGHSDGGTISLIFGAEQPPLLEGIITEAAHVFVEPETLQGIRTAERAFQQGKMRGLAKYHGEKTTAVFRAWSESWLDESFARWNIEDLLPSIACPVLAIQGRGDQYATPAQLKAIVSGVGPAARSLLIDGCGHSPHAERPEDVLNTMTRFIDACAGRALE